MSVTYVCPACGQGALGPGNCPACIKMRRYVQVRPIEFIGAVPLAQVRADSFRRLPVMGFPQIENVMNGGFVLGTVTLVYGAAGLGKTTLCLKMADNITRVWSRPSLYCSTEQTPEQVKMIALRAGVCESRTLVAYETHTEAIGRIVAACRSPFTVIDSLSNLAMQESIVVVTSRLVEMARTLDTALLLVLHETKDGDYNAPRQVEHLVDCMVRLSDGATDDMLPTLDWTVTGKYRFGPINRTAHLRFDRERIPYDPDAIGATPAS